MKINKIAVIVAFSIFGLVGCRTSTDVDMPVVTNEPEPIVTLTPTEIPATETPARAFAWEKKEDGTVIIAGLVNLSLEVIVIPKEIDGGKVTEIGSMAFGEGSRLTSIVIPDSVTKIGSWAFEGCGSLTGIVIPESVTEIGDYAFEGCSSLTSVVIPDNITKIGAGTFERCRSLASIVIPDGVTEIGSVAFNWCSSLTSIVIPDNVTEIGSCAFANCGSLASVVLSDGIDFGGGVFHGTPWLEKQLEKEPYIIIEGHLIAVAEVGENFTIPDDVICISGAFEDCEGLTYIEIPERITEVGDYTFRGCHNLNRIKFHDSVTKIGNYAFSECSNLTDMVIPAGVIEIGNGAFRGCSNLTNMVVSEGVKEIGSYTFSGCSNLTNIVIPAGVAEIGSYAFSECSNLREVIILDGVEKIDYCAFSGCSSLQSVVVPDSVTDINWKAFENANSALKLIISSGSYAEEWAIQNGYNVVVQGGTSEPTTTPEPTAIPTATPVPTPDVKQVMQEAFRAYGAFEKQLREDGIYYTAQYSFIYLDEDAIPECLLWADVMEGSTPAAVYVLSYREGEVLSYRGETAYLSIDSFDYTPRSGKFKIYSALGQGNSEMWLIGELTDDIRQIGEAAGWGYWDWEGTGEYIMCQSVNGKQVTPKEQGEYLNAHYCTDAVGESQRYGTMEKAYQEISK